MQAQENFEGYVLYLNVTPSYAYEGVWNHTNKSTFAERINPYDEDH